MNATYDELWSELRSFLEREGILPLQYDMLTPAEIARSVQISNGDIRPTRFVLSYYYPRRYGAIDGELSDDQAAELVNSFRKHRQPVVSEAPVLTASTEAITPEAEPCAICRSRRATHRETDG